MCAHKESSSEDDYYSQNMKIVASSILVMGVTLAVVIVLSAWFAHIGPSFSDDVLREQQRILRKQYSLPPTEEITPEEAQILPSLRRQVILEKVLVYLFYIVNVLLAFAPWHKAPAYLQNRVRPSLDEFVRSVGVVAF